MKLGWLEAAVLTASVAGASVSGLLTLLLWLSLNIDVSRNRIWHTPPLIILRLGRLAQVTGLKPTGALSSSCQT
jgi:hypothetical protein